jgi:hypothetical protein
MEGQQCGLKAFLWQSSAVGKGRNGIFCQHTTDSVGLRALEQLAVQTALATVSSDCNGNNNDLSTERTS